jgi:hypothetical protein
MALANSIRCFCRNIGVVLAITLGALLGDGDARGQSIDEYQFKAAFLYNVAQFVEWPAEAFKTPSDPIVNCILGDSPLTGALRRAGNGNVIGGRRFVTRNISDVKHLSGCHILFVSSSEEQRWRAMAETVQHGSGLLTVGENDGFASDGGILNFKLERGKIRIQINAAAAERQRLRISSRLLRLSQIVEDRAK